MNLKSTLKKSNEKSGLQSLLLSIAIFFLLVVIIWLFSNLLNFHEANNLPIHNDLYWSIQIFLALANSLLLIVLLEQYLENLLKFKTQFTLAFVVLAIVLLVHTITSNPLFFSYFGYTSMEGPFSTIPAIFTLFAVLVLLYLNSR